MKEKKKLLGLEAITKIKNKYKSVGNFISYYKHNNYTNKKFFIYIQNFIFKIKNSSKRNELPEFCEFFRNEVFIDLKKSGIFYYFFLKKCSCMLKYDFLNVKDFKF